VIVDKTKMSNFTSSISHLPSSIKGLWITGTDTGIGKTFVAEGIIRGLKRAGLRAVPVKPVETGCVKRGRVLYPSDTLRLLRAAGVDESIDLVNPYRFREPVAPYVASIINGTKIEKGKIHRALKRLTGKYDFLILETAGGLMVPIADRYLNIDMIRDSGLPIIIVSRPDLGTINHTLLTVTVARAKGINIKGVIFNHSRKKKRGIPEKTNPDIIAKFGDVEILGIVPFTPAGLPDTRVADLFSRIVMRIFLSPAGKSNK